MTTVVPYPKPTQWVINADVDFVTTLAQFGRFLENDYRMAIESLEIPRIFKENTEKSGRKFVIVGAKSVPTATAKSVFLCLKLACPESIIVKAPTLDEGFLIDNVIEYYGDGVLTKVFNSGSDELKLSHSWRSALDEATDIVVFGDQNTVDSFKVLENEHRRVHVHGPKFSLGIVSAELLTPTLINDMCFDFFSFYGEGCLSPRFYIIIGYLSKSKIQEISDTMVAFYGSFIDEFRSKMTLARKSELVQQLITANKVGPFLRVEQLKSNEIFTTLYGDARICIVDHLFEIDEFLTKWRDTISTVAVSDDDLDIRNLVEEQMITRICSIGEMQFPTFYEQFDTTDDFMIYAPLDED